MKTLILYKTKHGTTKEYAEFVHRSAPDSDLVDLNEFAAEKLGDYDTVVLGSRTYMGDIDGLHFLEKNWSTLKTKRVFLFAVGIIDPEAEASKVSYAKIPQQIRQHIRYLKVPGRISLDKLNWFENLVVKSQKGANLDKVNMNTVIPVINFIKETQQLSSEFPV